MPRPKSFAAALAGVAAAALALSAPALANHGPVGEPPLPEAQMRSFEAWLLGSEHAAEHAQARRQQGAAEAPALGPYALPREVVQAGRNAFDSPLNGGALAPAAGAYEPIQTFADDPRAQDGQWSAPFGLPLYAIHAAVLPTGKVLWFGPPDPGFKLNTTWAVLWDPTTGEQEQVDPPLIDGKPANLYCAGQAFLATGELLVAGGTLKRDDLNRPYGLDKVYTFDPWSETWTEQPEMESGRWYPTNVQLPDGRQIIMSGTSEVDPNAYNESIEIFTPGSGVGAQGSIATLEDGSGDTALRGTDGMPPTGKWYPHMFVMPSGRTLVAGPWQQDTWYLNTPNPATNKLEWSQARDAQWRRNYGNAVLLPPPPGVTKPSTTVMQLGGYAGNPEHPEIDGISLDFTETYDESDTSDPKGPPWVVHGEHASHGYPQDDPEHRMKVRRSNQNTVLLPDGTMVQVGGGEGADLYATQPDQKKVELWTPNPSDPTEGTWRFGAAQQDERAYHSTALLLPDGRVVSAGDDGNPPTPGGVPASPLDTAEVYSPPYLFKGPRPTISFAPDTVELSDTFDVETPSSDINRAVLIAPGATTHANDMHQRYVPLEMTKESDGVQLTTPASEHAVPPGYYMLFLVNEAGVPSIAKFVKVIADQPDGQINVVKQTDPDGAAETFSFTGDLGAFALRDGQANSVSGVPAGIHDVFESPFAGWGLTAISCSDGSPTDVGLRRARVIVAPGESVSCTFTNAVPPPGGGGGPPPGAKALSAAAATAYAKSKVAGKLGVAKRKVKASCKPSAVGFKCSFKVAGKPSYRGVLTLWDKGGAVGKSKLTYAGVCGGLGKGKPADVKTKNLTCAAARQMVNRWRVAGKAKPRGYECKLKPAPKRTFCKDRPKELSFKD